MPQAALKNVAHVEQLVPKKEFKPGTMEAFLEPFFRGIFGSLRYSAVILKVIHELDKRRPAEVLQYLEDDDIQGCILERGSPYSLQTPSGWQTHHAAQLLMNALSRLLLPDVSRLPLSAVAELKEHVKDDLDPMRADMLRLTNQLRAMVKEGHSQEDIAREARNLIATQVEPIVRESARHTADVMKTRWKALFRGALNFVTLGGLGFLSPAMFAKEAAISGAKLLTDASDAVWKVKPPTHAARFVLEVRGHLESA